MKYFIKKIITLIITLLFISLLTFTAFSVIPGDAAVSKLGVDASPEAIARVRAEYELFHCLCACCQHAMPAYGWM